MTQSLAADAPIHHGDDPSDGRSTSMSIPPAAGRGRVGASGSGLALDRRWRWLLAAGGLPAMAVAFAVAMVWVLAAVLVTRLVDAGPHEETGLVGLAAGAAAFACTVGASRWAARTRPWLFLAWQSTFHCGRSRWVGAGLTAAAYAAAGIRLPGDVEELYTSTSASVVGPGGELEAGDLVFFFCDAGPASSSRLRVAIYAGAAQVIEAAPRDGQVVVLPIGRVMAQAIGVTRPGLQCRESPIVDVAQLSGSRVGGGFR